MFKQKIYLKKNIDNFQKRKQNPTQLRITGQQLDLEQDNYRKYAKIRDFTVPLLCLRMKSI